MARLLGMSMLGSDYYYPAVVLVEHAERLRRAQEGRLVAPARPPGPARRVLGAALIRLGRLVRGPVPAPEPPLAPAGREGFPR